MKNRTIIFLSLTIVIMLGIITACVIYLYDGVDAECAVAKDDEVTLAESAEAQLETQKADSQAETKQAEVQPAQPKPEPEPEPVKKTAVEQKFQVKNSGTGKMNTLRQTPDGKLSLLDEKGNAQWTVELPSSVVGIPHEVDFFANKKIQYLFAAGDKLYLIDRLGRNVKTYPRNLGANALSDMKIVRNKAGKTYWRIETEDGPRFFRTKEADVLNQLPE